MGFPRILSKNHKIYTKLGEFCLSGDSFWIVCHTCQQELQTQDAFWKHIQDEHNFLHGVTKQGHNSSSSSFCLTDVESASAATSNSTAQAAAHVTTVAVPVAMYKYTDDEQRDVAAAAELHEAHQQHQQHLHQQQKQRDAAKELAELHAVAAATTTRASGCGGGGDSSAHSSSLSGGNDIKVEPTSLTLTPETRAATAAAAASSNTTIYHLSQVVPAPPAPPPTATSSFLNAGGVTTAAIVGVSTTITTATPQPQAQQSQLTSGNIPVMQLGMPLLAVAQELAPKDSNSTTASASSAVSSDDSERWYVCDYGTCGIKFKYKSRMELHRVVHSKERRFNCDMCDASFKQSCNLSTHRKKKHSVRGIKTDLLPQRF